MLSFKEHLSMDEAAIGGTFVGVRFDPNTNDSLEKWIEENNILNPVGKDKFHSTLIFSAVKLKNFKSKGIIDPPISAIPLEFKIWEVDGGLKFVLVLKLNSPELISRHKEIMNNHPEAVYNFPEYMPHMTLSYDIDPLFDIKKLTLLNFPKILIVEEYDNLITENFGK